MNWENKSTLTTVDEVEATIGRPAAMVMLKQISALDEGCRTVLARCPVAAFGYRDTGGASRTTFIGGTPGFTRVHSPTRISFSLPESGDPHGPVSFFFLLPGVGEILRVNGSVATRKGAQTIVDIEETYVHCAQAVLRSRLWQPPEPAEPAASIEGDGPLCRPGVAEFLAAAPFLALSTWDSAGGSDTSPRGDRQAVARILDGRTLVIPDRKGNKRADTLHNLLQDDRLSFAALVPGRSGVLHVRGRGAITDDPALLATMALRGMPPHAALLIDVEAAELTGNDAVARSRPWTPDAHVDRAAARDLIALAGEHLTANSANAEAGPPTLLLKVVGAIPGMTRLLRLVTNRAYRSGLRKEGYEDIQHSGLPHRRPADDSGTENPLREVRIAEVRRETPSTVTLVLEDAGSGVTPMMSMIRTQLANRTNHGRIALLYSSRTEEEIIFADELAQLEKDNPDRLSVTHVLSRRDGRLGADDVRHWVTGLSPAQDAHYYVCGPEPLMDAVQGVLTGLGVPDELVHHEHYTSATDTAAATTVPQEMTVEENGHPISTAVVEPGQTLLDAGLAAGLSMPYSCTVGNCGDCMVKLRSGTFAQNEPNCLTPQQKADGYVLTCVNCPLSEVTLDITDP